MLSKSQKILSRFTRQGRLAALAANTSCRSLFCSSTTPKFGRQPYPSREVGELAGSHFYPRREPVLYSKDYGLSPGLSSEQAKFFDENGYVVLPSLFSQNEADSILSELKALMEVSPAHSVSDPRVVTEPNSHKVRSIFEVHKHNSLFNKLSRDERLVRIAQQILNDDVYIHQSRINFQQEAVGTGFMWHSDFETWHLEDGMPQMRSVSCVVMLSDNHSYNGALMVIPGSHKVYVTTPGETPEQNWLHSLKYTLKNGSPTMDALNELIKNRQLGINYIEGSKGSVFFFDCNLLHGSHNNITPFPRANSFMVYNAVTNKLGPPLVGQGRPEYIATRDENWCKPIIPDRFHL